MPRNWSSFNVQEWATKAILLVEADEPAFIRRLEGVTGCTQDEAVNLFIENFCWAADLAEFADGKGTPGQRRYALRCLWRAIASAQTVSDG